MHKYPALCVLHGNPRYCLSEREYVKHVRWRSTIAGKIRVKDRYLTKKYEWMIAISRQKTISESFTISQIFRNMLVEIWLWNEVYVRILYLRYHTLSSLASKNAGMAYSSRTLSVYVLQKWPRRSHWTHLLEGFTEKIPQFWPLICWNPLIWHRRSKCLYYAPTNSHGILLFQKDTLMVF